MSGIKEGNIKGPEGEWLVIKHRKGKRSIFE